MTTVYIAALVLTAFRLGWEWRDSQYERKQYEADRLRDEAWDREHLGRAPEQDNR